MPEVVAENVVPVLDHGFLALDAALASDLAVVNGARVSFNQESDEMTERDAGLIRFLVRNRHGSPFEHGYFRFLVKAPLFVVREHHRHRAGHCLPGTAMIWMETIAPRSVLPLTMYTKYYWSCNPRSLMHFCGLRNHDSAQYEIREYAAAAESFLERLMPVTHTAFVANGRVAP